MSKVNISLVGGQPMPVYVGLEIDKYDIYLLVHSPESKSEAEKIKENSENKFVFYELSPVDYPVIWKEIEDILMKYQNDDVYVNISGGTKPWTVAFVTMSVKYDNVHAFYIDQNNVYYDMDTKTRKQIESIDWETATILKYNNQNGFSRTLLTDYTSDDLLALKHVKEARMWNYDDFNALTIPSGKDKKWKNILENDSEPEKFLETGSFVTFNKKEQTVYLEIFNKRKGLHHWLLKGPHVGEIIFNSGWFEYEVAMMLSRWHYSKEIWLNVKFPYVGGKAKNEIDIIVNTGGKLLFVECKTSIYNNTDIDKFNNAVRNYGGMGCKALFVTEYKFNFESLQKCQDSGIMFFTIKDKSKKNRNENELFDMLDNEIKNINKR